MTSEENSPLASLLYQTCLSHWSTKVDKDRLSKNHRNRMPNPFVTHSCPTSDQLLTTHRNQVPVPGPSPNLYIGCESQKCQYDSDHQDTPICVRSHRDQYRITSPGRSHAFKQCADHWCARIRTQVSHQKYPYHVTDAMDGSLLIYHNAQISPSVPISHY